MSWGTFWGTYWGGFGGATLSPAAWAIGERQVWATFASPPLAKSTITQGDALNPASWTVTRSDTGESLLVIGVRSITPNTFELYLLRKLAPFLVPHSLVAHVLDALSLGAVTLSRTFAGCAYVPPAEYSGGTVDIANPYFVGVGDEPAAHLIVGSSGDYQHESGVPLWRKLTIRRLSSLPSEFFHLSPTQYGLGLRVKDVPAAGRLAELQVEIVQQLLREPEFEAVRVRLRLTSNGALLIQVRVRIAVTGDTGDFDILTAPAEIRL